MEDSEFPPSWAEINHRAERTRLEVMKGGAVIDKVVVGKKAFHVLGRNSEMSDVVLEHESISRKHVAVVHNVRGGVFLYDMGSQHGTYLDGAKLSPREYHAFREGQTLTVGQSSRKYVLKGVDMLGESSGKAVAAAKKKPGKPVIKIKNDGNFMAMFKAQQEGGAPATGTRAMTAPISRPSTAKKATVPEPELDMSALGLPAGFSDSIRKEEKARATQIANSIKPSSSAAEDSGRRQRQLEIQKMTESFKQPLPASTAEGTAESESSKSAPEASAAAADKAPPADVATATSAAAAKQPKESTSDDGENDSDDEEEDMDASHDGGGSGDEFQQSSEDAARSMGIPISHEAHFNAHEKTVSTIAMDPSGSRIATGSYDYEVKLWDFGGMVRARKAFRTFFNEEGNYVISNSYSPNGDRFLSCCGSAQPKIFTKEGEGIYN
jgi:pSer/pThr/pTyr-binding forkhead associated (FHA) protein